MFQYGNAGDSQCCYNVFFDFLSIGFTLHCNLVGPSKCRLGDLILYALRKMGLVDNRENVVSSLNSKTHKSSVLYHKYVILRIRYDCCLILRDLNHRQAQKFDDGVGN